MDREYIIAGFRIRLEQVDRLFVRPGSHMARAFEPFAAEADPAASLTMRLIPDCTINKELTGGEPNRELDVFPFDDAEADCHFERTPRGYLFRMVPRNGDRPTLFFKAFNSPDVQSDLLADGREPHQSLMRFGLWIMFGIAISPEAIAIHSSTIECEGRAVLFLGESGTGKSTHTRLWQEHIPGARLLNDDSPIIRMYQGQATAFGSPWSGKTPCYRNISRPIAGIVRLSQAPANEITRLSILRAVGSLLPSCPPAFAYDSDLQDRICRTLSDILTQAPVWHLACLPAGQGSGRTLLRHGPRRKTESLKTIDHGKNRSEPDRLRPDEGPAARRPKRTNLRPGTEHAALLPQRQRHHAAAPAPRGSATRSGGDGRNRTRQFRRTPHHSGDTGRGHAARRWQPYHGNDAPGQGLWSCGL